MSTPNPLERSILHDLQYGLEVLDLSPTVREIAEQMVHNGEEPTTDDEWSVCDDIIRMLCDRDPEYLNKHAKGSKGANDPS